MGSSASASCAPSTRTQTEYVKAPSKKKSGAESKEAEEVEAARIHRQFEQKLQRIEESLKRDVTMPNLINELSNLIEMEGLDKMACVRKIVESMGTEWRKLMADEVQLTKAVGTCEMNKLKSLRARYFGLLLKTKTVVVGLLEESEIQQENVQDSLRVVKTAREQGEAKLSEQDKLEFDESVKNLAQWIDQSELLEITEKWNQLCQELEAQRTRFQRYFESYKNKSFWTKVVIGLGAVIGLAFVIGVIIATSGAAAPAAAAAAAAAGTKVTIGTTLAVSAGAGFATSAGLVGGGLCYGYYVKPDAMAQKIQKMTKMLNDYIVYANKLQFGVNQMDATNKKISKQLKFDNETCLKLSRSLKKIDMYLYEYIRHGRGVLVEIDNACQEFMK